MRPQGRLFKAATLLCAAILPCAVAAQSNIAFTGDLNIVAARYIGADATQARTLNRVDSYGSNVALSGTDKSDGLTVAFFLSNGFRIDTGTGSICSRECWVGVSGDFGTLKAGRTLAIYDDVSFPWYFVESAGNHNPAALWANCGNGGGMADGCMDSFLPNSLRYDSPVFSNISASFSFALPGGEANAAPQEARVLAAGAVYRKRSVYLGLAHQNQRNARAPGSSDNATTLSAQYQGAFNIGIGYEHLRYSVAEGGLLSRDYVGVMANKRFSRHTVWGNYGFAGKGYGTAGATTSVNTLTHLSRSGTEMISLGYQYRFSKTVQVYAFFNQLRNQENGKVNFDAAVFPDLGKGKRITAMAVGTRVRF